MNKTIKIIYLIAESSPYGSNSALLNLLDMVIPKGVEPVVVMAGKGGLCEKLDERNIPYYQIKYYYSVYPQLKSLRNLLFCIPILARTLLHNYIATNLLVQLAHKYNADLIHTNISPLHIGYNAAKKMNIPHVWHIREYQDLYFGWHPLFSMSSFMRKLNSKNNHPIAITKGLFDHYKMMNNARVIYDGVMSETKMQYIPEKEKYFLFVGRLEEAKGIINLIAAFTQFAKKENEFKLLIVGDGTLEFKTLLLKMVNALQMIDRIHFLGFRNDVNDLMAHAMALVVSSSFEGFGFTTVEAMFNGCLVIGNDSGGTKEILEQENLGILYKDQYQLTDALIKLVSVGIKYYTPVILKAQEKAFIYYSCERNAERVLKFYAEIISSKNIS